MANHDARTEINSLIHLYLRSFAVSDSLAANFELTGSYSLPWIIKAMGQDRGVESPLPVPYRDERQEASRSVVCNRPVQPSDCEITRTSSALCGHVPPERF